MIFNVRIFLLLILVVEHLLNADLFRTLFCIICDQDNSGSQVNLRIISLQQQDWVGLLGLPLGHILLAIVVV